MKKFTITVKKPKVRKHLPSHLTVTKVEKNKTSYSRAMNKRIEKDAIDTEQDQKT